MKCNQNFQLTATDHTWIIRVYITFTLNTDFTAGLVELES